MVSMSVTPALEKKEESELETKLSYQTRPYLEEKVEGLRKRSKATEQARA